MRKSIIVTFFAALGVPNAAIASHWVRLAETYDNVRFFYEAESIISPERDVVRVWGKRFEQGSDDQIKYVFEFNCRLSEMRMLDARSHGKNADSHPLVFNPNWFHIDPDDRFFTNFKNTVCRAFKQSKER